MTYRRKTIRDQIKKLLAGQTDAGQRVYTNRSSPTWQEELNNGPVILIYTLNENVERYAQSPREYKRQLEVTVEIIATGPEDDTCPENCELLLDDILDMMAFQVDCYLLVTNTLGCDENNNAFVDEFQPLSVRFDFDSSGQKPIGSAILTYQAVYHENQPADLSKLENLGIFERAGVDWKVGHHDDEPDADITEANDLIDIPQT